MSEDETPSTAAEMRAMAEQADAEAAEAEALAAAARARARAVQMRRQAALVEATEEDDSHADEPGESEEDVPSGLAVDTAARTPAASRRWPIRSSRPRLSTIAATCAVIATLAAVAGSVYMVGEHRDATQQHERAAEFAAAARQGIVNLTSLDFKDAKGGVQRIIDDSTGAFKDDFQKTADDFIKVVEQSKVVEQGVVRAAAVDLDSMTSDSAVVLVASTSEVTNAAGAKKDPRNFRLIVTVTRDGDQIKMSKVEFVP